VSGAPWLGSHAAERNAGIGNRRVVELEGYGDRDEGELVRLAIAEFQVERPRRQRGRWQLDRGDQLAVCERMLDLRRVARKQVEVVD